ncbi:myosin heavy chain, clone 203-like [Euwallacea similis]|uniref:myosin heavy chain, clone 203-like n=1 Tax=Euwallacea similis TaxID=1736056 RepID=UPI00344DE084
MPPQLKTKKGGLSDAQIETTVRLIRDYWPDYPVNISNIRNPNKLFVLKFYRDCVANLDEKCAYVTRTEASPDPPGLGEEELLFLKLSRSIPPLMDAHFKLGDLLVFDPKRLNSHILVTMHFLIATEQCINVAFDKCKEVFDMQNKLENDKAEIDRLKEEILVKQQTLKTARSENHKLKQIAEHIAPEYTDTVLLIEDSERKCKDSIMEIKKLKTSLETLQKEIEKLENTEQQLKEQVVSEQEYSTLKDSLNLLIKEEQRLEEEEKTNDLCEQKQQVDLLQTCLHKLEHLKLPTEIFHLAELRSELNNEQQNVDYMTNIQKVSEDEMDKFHSALATEKTVACSERNYLEEQLQKTMERGLLEVAAQKNKLQHFLKEQEATICDLRQKVSLTQKDYEKLNVEMQKRANELVTVQPELLQILKCFLDCLGKSKKSSVE